MAIFEELKRRRLAQIALVYIGAGWVCIEIADFIVGTYDFSRKVLDTVVMLAVIGFPTFLVIGWFHGERGHQRVQRSEVWLLLTLGVMGVVGTYQIATGESLPEPVETQAAAPAEGDGQLTNLDDSRRAGPSLAILPFRNNISDPELDWLGTGLADLLTTNFAQLPGLQVVGRQSLYDLLTEEGRTEDETIPESLATTVARAAGAEMMLWGTVTKNGDDFVIDAQILDLASGSIRAADRKIGPDVFVLVDELTASLVQRIRPERGTDANAVRLARFGTKDMGALRSYQRGIAADRQGRHDEATEFYAEALKRDTTFILPLGRLEGHGQAVVMSIGATTDTDESVDAVEMVIESEDARAAIKAAERHRERAMLMFQDMADEAGLSFDGKTSEEFLADLESTISRAVSGIRRLDPDMLPDSLRPPRGRNRRPPPNF